jgi:hypothetical protein
MRRKAMIVGLVEYREGDGPIITIRKGACEVEQGAQDATLSWEDADTHGAAAMPLSDFQRYLSSAAIRWVGEEAAAAPAALRASA